MFEPRHSTESWGSLEAAGTSCERPSTGRRLLDGLPVRPRALAVEAVYIPSDPEERARRHPVVHVDLNSVLGVCRDRNLQELVSVVRRV